MQGGCPLLADWGVGRPVASRGPGSPKGKRMTTDDISDRETAELATLERDHAALRRWFDADPGRQQRHASAYEELERRERERRS